MIDLTLQWCSILLLVASAALCCDPSSSMTPTQQPARGALWSADHETGDLSQWYSPALAATGAHGGGIYNSGAGVAAPSRDFAHSGSWSARLTINTPDKPTSGTRLFRWRESHAHPDLYYDVWLYFPSNYVAPSFWNVMQWKSLRAGHADSDPFFFVNIRSRADRSMEFNLFNWQTKRNYYQQLATLPVGRWFRVTAHYVCSGSPDGSVTVWQDGVLLFDVRNVQTRYTDGDCGWSVNNYSDQLVPASATIYVDDAMISTIPPVFKITTN
ncbi:MAG: heparin lyase I family protein [Terriglobales bacterium]